MDGDGDVRFVVVEGGSGKEGVPALIVLLTPFVLSWSVVEDVLLLLAVELARRTVTRGLAPSGTAPGSVVHAMNKDTMASKAVGTYTNR